MPKENKNTSRRSRRLSTEFDNASATNSRDMLKSMPGNNRYSPFSCDASRRDSRTMKEERILPSNDVLRSMSGGIIESGMKYIMFPLHLLRFCIFGTNSDSSIEYKELAEVTDSGSRDKSYEEKDRSKKNSSEREVENSKEKTTSTLSSKDHAHDRTTPRRADRSKDASPSRRVCRDDNKSDSEDSNDEMVTAEEDSDSCAEQWCSASSTMIMNMSVDCDNFDRLMPYTASEEPMDISMDEQVFDKTYTVVKTSRDCRLPENTQSNSSRRIYSRPCVDEQDSSSSVDEEIARIFRQQCTSSEDERPPARFPKSRLSHKYAKTKENNFLHKGVYDRYTPTIPRSRESVRDCSKEQKKKPSTEFVGNNKRRKVTHEEDRGEKHLGRKSENKKREDRCGSVQDTSSKHKSRSSRNSSSSSARSKESKGKCTKYRETATQTDSAFSDEDVEMVPVDASLSERQLCCKHGIRRSQINPFRHKEMEHEVNYIADNEDSNDGYLRIVQKRMSPCSTSSSSTDLGFDERASIFSDAEVAIGSLHPRSPDNESAFRAYSRAPPGFPKVPQNPPLTSHCGDSNEPFLFASLKDGNSTTIVPPAPSPLRHLYYDYPEFMDHPTIGKSSKILNNILRYNYPL